MYVPIAIPPRIPARPIVIVQPVAELPDDAPTEGATEPEPAFEEPGKISNSPVPSKRNFEPAPESKKDFVSPPISKKEFEPEPAFEDEIEIDRDGDVGRWRKDTQVAEIVIYRWEWKVWPSDVPVETGLRSYYELRYFDEGTNRKGVKYSELYAKHRAKRNLWIRQYRESGSIDEADLDTPTVESNVVHFPDRRTNSAG